MFKLNQKGFSAVEGVLIGVIVILLAAGGYYIYSQNIEDETVGSSENSETVAVSDDDTTPVSDDSDDDSQVPDDWVESSDYSEVFIVAYPKYFENDNRLTFNVARTKASEYTTRNFAGGCFSVDEENNVLLEGEIAYDADGQISDPLKCKNNSEQSPVKVVDSVKLYGTGNGDAGSVSEGFAFISNGYVYSWGYSTNTLKEDGSPNYDEGEFEKVQKDFKETLDYLVFNN